jgi:hypothetical protein
MSKKMNEQEVAGTEQNLQTSSVCTTPECVEDPTLIPEEDNLQVLSAREGNALESEDAEFGVGESFDNVRQNDVVEVAAFSSDDASEDANTAVDTFDQTDEQGLLPQTPNDDMNVLIDVDGEGESGESPTATPHGEVNLITDTVARQQYLEGQTEVFRQKERSDYVSDDEKGKLLFEVWTALEKTDQFWIEWVENDLGIPRRTAQRLRDVYGFYWAACPSDMPPVAQEYRAQVGITKLDLIRTLRKAPADKLKLKGITDLSITESAISITITSHDDDHDDDHERESNTYDAADPALTVRMLRERMPKSPTLPVTISPQSLEEQLRQLRLSNKKLLRENKELEKKNAILQGRVVEAEVETERLREELEVLYEKLAAHDDMTETE